MPSGGGRNRPSMGNVQIGDGRHRGKKGWEPARQRIPCDVPAAPPVQRHLREPGPYCDHLAVLAAGPASLRGRVLLRGARFRSGPWRGSSLGTACGSYYESTRAHIDESRRSRVMASGNWPVKFCPLRSLQESALAASCIGSKRAAKRGHTCSLSCRCTTGRPVPLAPCRSRVALPFLTSPVLLATGRVP